MNFENATLVTDIMWYDGPLLSQLEMDGKTYLVKWADRVDESYNVWLIVEVSPEDLGLYLGKALTMLDLEERSPAVFVQEGYVEERPAVPAKYDDVPDDWKAPSTSYYDESLQYGY